MNRKVRLVIAGSRQYGPKEFAEAMAYCPWTARIETILSGGCRGIDECGERYAREVGVELEVYRADWDRHGKAAGPIRNRIMAIHSHCLLAVWDGKSRGTRNMIEEARKRGKEVVVYYPETKEVEGP